MKERDNPFAAPKTESATLPAPSIFDDLFGLFYAVANGFLFVVLACFVGGVIAGLFKLMSLAGVL